MQIAAGRTSTTGRPGRGKSGEVVPRVERRTNGQGLLLAPLNPNEQCGRLSQARASSGGDAMQPGHPNPTVAPASPLQARSTDAFYRNLPKLLKKHYGKWVAYHGDE